MYKYRCYACCHIFDSPHNKEARCDNCGVRNTYELGKCLSHTFATITVVHESKETVKARRKIAQAKAAVMFVANEISKGASDEIVLELMWELAFVELQHLEDLRSPT